MPYMVTFTINIPQMLAYIPYMDPMGYIPLYPNKISHEIHRSNPFNDWFHSKSI